MTLTHVALDNKVKYFHLHAMCSSSIDYTFFLMARRNATAAALTRDAPAMYMPVLLDWLLSSFLLSNRLI